MVGFVLRRTDLAETIVRSARRRAGLTPDLVNLSNAHDPLRSCAHDTSGVAMISSVRRWSTGVGLAGAAACAAMIGIGAIHTDTPDDVFGRAGQDLTEPVDALEQAPTAGLEREELSSVRWVGVVHPGVVSR